MSGPGGVRLTTPEPRRCPECGAELAADAPEGLCPKCLLKAGLAGGSAGSFAAAGDPTLPNKAAGSQPLPGTKVRYFGDYQLLEEIARGGMGVVYKARQVSLNRVVAVKMILAGQLAGEADVKRFYTEAQAAANLQHPGIVAIHEVGQHEGQHYFSMDFVDGKTLAQLVRESPLPAEKASGYVKSIAEAIHYAHQHGILHRDLKPSNVLIDPFDRPRITDFGIAKRIEGGSELTHTGDLLGTPGYMPPEQAAATSRTPLGPTTDVYALGAILYELLTGRPPFRAATPLDTLLQVLQSEPVPPRLLNPKLPRDLETICLKALSKEPYRRYPSAAELANDLGRYLAGQPVLARPVSSTVKLWRWCRRNPRVAALSAAVLLLLIAVAAGSTIAAFRISAARNDATRNAQAAQLAAAQARSEAETNRLNLYATRIKLAHRSWEGGDTSRALELLGSLRPRPDQEDLRGFEWYYLWRLCHSAQRTLGGHTGPVRYVAYAPDGQTIATAGHDSTVKLWDATTGAQRFTLRGHDGSVTCLKFSPDGQLLATGSADKTVKLWNPATAKMLATLPHRDPVSCLALTSDGKTLAAGTGLLGVEHGNPLTRFVGGDVAGELKLWDMAGRKEIVVLNGHTAHVLSAAFSPDNRLLASASADRTVKLWDVAQKKELASLTGHRGIVFSLAFAPDGKTLATGGGDPYLGSADVKLWDVAGRKVLAGFQGHTGPVLSVAFAPDGKKLATGASDQIVKLWDVAAAQDQATLRGHMDRVLSVAFSPDGTRLATASRDGTVKLWDPTRRQEADILKGQRPGTATGSYSLTFHPDGKTLASATYVVKLWDVEAGREVVTFEGYQTRDISLALSPDGKTLAAAGVDGVVMLWNISTRQLRTTLRGHTSKVWSLAFTPDGKTLVTGGDGGIVKLWDVATAAESFTIHPNVSQVRFLAMAPDGKTLATAGHPPTHPKRHSTVMLWDLDTRRLVDSLPGHSNHIEWVAFAPDGKTLATGSVDKTVKLWDLASRQERATLKGHTDSVYYGVFSPDGKTLATASWDGSLRLWHTATAQELITLKGAGGVLWFAAFSPDGQMLATSSGSNEVGEAIIFRAPPEHEVPLKPGETASALKAGTK